MRACRSGSSRLTGGSLRPPVMTHALARHSAISEAPRPRRRSSGGTAVNRPRRRGIPTRRMRERPGGTVRRRLCVMRWRRANALHVQSEPRKHDAGSDQRNSPNDLRTKPITAPPEPRASRRPGAENPRSAGTSRRADEGTRTLDLLHGKQYWDSWHERFLPANPLVLPGHRGAGGAAGSGQISRSSPVLWLYGAICGAWGTEKGTDPQAIYTEHALASADAHLCGSRSAQPLDHRPRMEPQVQATEHPDRSDARALAEGHRRGRTEPSSSLSCGGARRVVREGAARARPLDRDLPRPLRQLRQERLGRRAVQARRSHDGGDQLEILAPSE